MTEGIIPLSPALAEASSESLSELMSRDPEGFQSQDLKRIIAELRAQRERWAAAEASGTTRKASGAKASPTTTPKAIEEILKSGPKSADDIF